MTSIAKAMLVNVVHYMTASSLIYSVVWVGVSGVMTVVLTAMCAVAYRESVGEVGGGT